MTATARPTRILFVVTGLDVGGIETYVLRLAKFADPARYRIEVCHEDALPARADPRDDDDAGPGALPDYAAALRALGCRVFRVTGKRRAVGFTARLLFEIRTHGYDAVCDFTGDFAAPSLVAARLAGVPRRVAFYRSSGISHATDPARTLYRRVSRAVVARAATHVLANSRAALAAFYPGVMPGARPDADKYGVLVNGVDTARFAPVDAGARAAAKARWGLAGRFVLGHVGGFKPVKNHALLVEVLAAVRVRVPDAALLLVGDGTERPAVEAALAARGLGAHAVLTGIQRDVAGCLAAMDVFVFPSRYEGMSNALAEAQAAGLPAVASAAPGVAEHVPDGARAFVIPSMAPEPWTHAVERLAADDALRAEQGRIQRAHAVARYDHRERMDELLRLLAAAPARA